MWHPACACDIGLARLETYHHYHFWICLLWNWEPELPYILQLGFLLIFRLILNCLCFYPGNWERIEKSSRTFQPPHAKTQDVRPIVLLHLDLTAHSIKGLVSGSAVSHSSNWSNGNEPRIIHRIITAAANYSQTNSVTHLRGSCSVWKDLALDSTQSLGYQRAGSKCSIVIDIGLKAWSRKSTYIQREAKKFSSLTESEWKKRKMR